VVLVGPTPASREVFMPGRRPVSRKKPPVSCPFCKELTPRPTLHMLVYSIDGARGGTCACGAAFVIDETGKNGGMALLDVLAMALDGDLDGALKLQARKDYRLAVINDPSRPSSPTGIQPKIWFAKLTQRGKDAEPAAAD
jgi:hypothetical protein